MARKSLGETLRNFALITPASREDERRKFRAIYEYAGGDMGIAVQEAVELSKALGAGVTGIGLAFAGINMLKKAAKIDNPIRGIVGILALSVASESAKVAIRAIDNNNLLGEVLREHQIFPS
jgi:hypothetical protein